MAAYRNTLPAQCLHIIWIWIQKKTANTCRNTYSILNAHKLKVLLHPSPPSRLSTACLSAPANSGHFSVKQSVIGVIFLCYHWEHIVEMSPVQLLWYLTSSLHLCSYQFPRVLCACQDGHCLLRPRPNIIRSDSAAQRKYAPTLMQSRMASCSSCSRTLHCVCVRSPACSAASLSGEVPCPFTRWLSQ